MSEPQAAAAPAPTLDQANAATAAARAARLDSAISQALASKLPPAPKAPRAATKAPAAVASPAATDTSSLASSATIEPAAPDADTEHAALGALGLDGAPVVAAEGEPSGEPLESAAGDPAEPGPAVDVDALNALAKKRDLRAVEKALGLEEGVLGATNGEYAALRRRSDEVAAREKVVQDTHDANQGTLIRKFGPTVELLDLAAKGNVQAYALAIERTTGVSIGEFVKHYAANVPQIHPRVLELERENARLRASGEPAPPAPAAAPTVQTAVQKADTYIAAEAKDHPALKLKGGPEEVRAVWLKSFDKASKAFKLTPLQAAAKVVETRRQVAEQESWLLAGKEPPKAPRTRAISRTGASETQPRKTNLTRDQLIERGAAEIRRQKMVDAARSRR